jgi:CRISPR-associated protein Csb2
MNEGEASHAASQALRHAGITTPIETICVRREPFFSKGARAEAFSKDSRFEAARLWHLEITFAEPIFGPLVIGDGRYCGLGLMAPVRDCFRDAMILWMREDIRPPLSHRTTVVEALRRALMSRAADPTGRISTLFSGHESGPDPARSGRHRHVYLFADDSDGDGFLDRIGIIAPWRVDRSWRPSNEDRALFENVTGDLGLIRAGAAGVLVLRSARDPDADDPLFAHARTWTSRTPYRPTRHARRGGDVLAAAADDLLRECLWRGLPRPEIEVTRLETGPRGGISAEARLRFNVAVAGPILLGRDAHRGGGLFAGKR